MYCNNIGLHMGYVGVVLLKKSKQKDRRSCSPSNRLGFWFINNAVSRDLKPVPRPSAALKRPPVSTLSYLLQLVFYSCCFVAFPCFVCFRASAENLCVSSSLCHTASDNPPLWPSVSHILASLVICSNLSRVVVTYMLYLTSLLSFTTFCCWSVLSSDTVFLPLEQQQGQHGLSFCAQPVDRHRECATSGQPNAGNA